MKKVLLFLIALFCTSSLFAKITVQKDSKGWRLLDGNTEVEVKGITWSNNPIGENYNYSLWNKDDEFIKKMIDYDMPMLKAMGVNAIRCFNDVPPRWVEYIYENYGIYTIINNLLGRYGTTVNGVWHAKTDYSDEETRKVLIASQVETARKYKDTNGVLMYMLGNESNYGLEWSGSDIENLPVGERHKAKAVYLYTMFNEAIEESKKVDGERPYGIVNGDTQYIDLIAEHCPSMDVFGSNVYRGWKFYDSFYLDVKAKLDRPIIVTECGADAFNSLTGKEDQYAQLQYYKSQWREVYEQAYGKGNAGNILGCFVFEWVDEWWKYLQYAELTTHNTNASWANSGYSLDFKDGQNNMSEEWFGICAQSEEMVNGINKRVPRAIYYFLQDIWQMSLYNASPAEIEKKFANLPEAIYLARGNDQSVKSSINEFNMLKVESLNTTVQATTPVHFNSVIDAMKGSGNFRDAFVYKNASKADNPEATTVKPTVAAETSLGLSVKPFENLSGSTVIKAWTSEPISRLRDPYACYYESVEAKTVAETATSSAFDNKKYVDLYSANLNYYTKHFALSGFYHTGHGSYAGKGDIFNISKEAYDIIGYDTYGSKAPIGLEFTGYGKLYGLNVIGGPEIWGGAAPMIIANYYKYFPEKGLNKPSFAMAATFSSEFGQSSIPNQDPYHAYGYGTKASVYGEMNVGNFVNSKLGLLYAGTEKIGVRYDSYSGEQKLINYFDCLGAYLQLGTRVIPHTFLYVDGIYRGLVAETNPQDIYGGFYTGDSGSGNRIEMKLGAEIGFGPLGINPVLRMRTPIEKATGARDLIAGSPFIVGLANRQCLEVETIVTYDTEGGTWFYDWNNDEVENSKLAFSVSGHYVVSAGETDKLVYKDNAYVEGVSSTGVHKVFQNWVAADGLGPQANMWELGTRIVSNPIPGWRIIGKASIARTNAFTGWAADEYITFGTIGLSTRYKNLIFASEFIINGCGPESWWRNFNMTFPLQYNIDIAYGFGKNPPSFLDSLNRVGIRFTGRNFGESSSDAYHALPESISGVATPNLDGQKYMELTFYLSLGLM